MLLPADSRNQILYGLTHDISDDVKDALTAGIDGVSQYFEKLKNNTVSSSIFGNKSDSKKSVKSASGPYSDAFYYTNLADMINGDNRFVAECGAMLDAIASKNRKYYSIIKDYQIMDILIPQINRVLMFLVNECISPDIHNEHTFDIKYNSQSDKDDITREIEAIRKELGLDADLRTVYTNRLKLGREYRIVTDYNQSYQDALEMLQKARLNEDTSATELLEGFDHILEPLMDRIDELAFTINEAVSNEVNFSEKLNEASSPSAQNINVDITGLNIEIYRSSVVPELLDAKASIVNETASFYAADNIRNLIRDNNSTTVLTEAAQPIDKDRLTSVINDLKKKELRRCMIRRPDPAKMFKLVAAGREIGYLYTEDIDDADSKTVNVAQALKDRLLKARVTSMSQSFTDAEEIIAKQLAEKILKTFDPNIGINRVEDIDLLHNYLVSSGIVNGNKRITFYYKDDIYDMSRPDDSILTNAVFFTKLYSTLMLNNVLTKVLRGRGRQIHTVNMGVSPMVKKYVVNAMAALTMPENNLGTLHGSFEQLLNPLNAASDIVIPSEDGAERYITTDYIEGQNVDMDNDFLKFLLNSIVSSFGLDPAVLDATNGNIQFAKTLTMESVQICILILNEQNTLIDAWKDYVLKCLSIEGSDKLRSAISSGMVDVKFFAPKSLTLQMSVDEINNAKTHAEAIADVIPLFNVADGPEIDAMRSEFVFNMIKNNTNIDWSTVDLLENDAKIEAIDIDLQKQIIETIRSYKENTQNRDYDTMTQEDLQDDNMIAADNTDADDLPSEDELAGEEDLGEEDMGDLE